jgi:hypothetical protein
VAQALLGTVAGLCGAGAEVEVTPAWREPLVLWQALVGGPSHGRSPALAPFAGLLRTLEDERRAADPAAPALVLEETALPVVLKAVTARRRGMLLWCDTHSWLAAMAGERTWLRAWPADRLPEQAHSRFAVSVVGCLEAGDMTGTLERVGTSLASRLLYTWPQPAAPRPLAELVNVRQQEALGLLRRILLKARTPEDPLVLSVDTRGRAALDAFLPKLHAEMMAAEGFDAAWLGKGRGSIVRLAGILEMLVWSATGASGPPGHIGSEQVETAVRLWWEYFRPHARAVFGRGLPSDTERRAHRVARWLKLTGVTEISREDIRCHALSWTVDAEAADMVLYRLAGAGVLRFKSGPTTSRGGRRAHRWEVNPAFASL